MSVTVLNEFSGNLLSPFMNPVLYFSVSGAGSIVDPVAEIEFNGTTENIVFDAVFEKTISTVHYFFVDLSDVMKYLMNKFDGGNYPDNLEFINNDRLQLFDEYFRNLTIDIYFERETENEQTLSVTNSWIYLANQIPYSDGFYLSNVEALGNIIDLKLKWSKDTYNAIFFWHPLGALNIQNGTTEIINNILSFTNSNFNTFSSSDANILSAIADSSGKYAKSNTLYVIADDVITITNNLILNSGAAPTVCLRRIDTQAPVSNVETLSVGNNSKTLISTYTGHVILTINSTAATDFALGQNTIIYSAGYYQLKFSKMTTKIMAGINTITISDGEGNGGIITIDYDPDCTSVFNLCWQHPLLGYVSYPFQGVKQTNITAKKTNEFEKFQATMVNVNSLKEIMGYDETRKISLTSKINDEYWPLIEYLYSSRHVYLFVGSSGANDTTGTWVECEVSGSCTHKSERVKGNFTVDLILPESFNVKF